MKIDKKNSGSARENGLGWLVKKNEVWEFCNINFARK